MDSHSSQGSLSNCISVGASLYQYPARLWEHFDPLRDARSIRKELLLLQATLAACYAVAGQWSPPLFLAVLKSHLAHFLTLFLVHCN